MKKLILSFVVLVFFPLCLLSQSGRGILSFFVRDAENGYGIKAKITIESNTNISILKTDDGGHLFFTGTPGRYDLSISAENHQPLQTYFVIEMGKTLNIEVLMDRTVKTMVPYTYYSEAIIQGYVVGIESGEPIAGVEVQMDGKISAKTNAEGFFHIQTTEHSIIKENSDKPIRKTFSFVKDGYSTYHIKNLLIVPDKIKLKIALSQGDEEKSREYFQHILDGTQEQYGEYERVNDKIINSDYFHPQKTNMVPSLSGCNIPSTIRVGTGCSCTSCGGVTVMSLQYYSESGIDDEWISSWQFESLAAGSVPYRSYGAWYVNNPVDANYDIASTSCNQVWNSDIYSNSQSAAQSTAGDVLTINGVNPARAEYSAENNGLGAPVSVSCGNCYSGTGSTWPCISDNVCCGTNRFGHGRGMCQWGSQRWALNGQNHTWIIDHYYTPGNVSICGSSSSPPSDVTPPTTQINAPSAWQNNDFQVTFSDADDSSGIGQQFYQALEYRTGEYRANGNKGFFNDNFNVVHPDWTIKNGAWSVNGNGELQQTDTALGNTNIYASLDQNPNTVYLYDWDMKIGGSGTNRRAGIHFFADTTTANRGNSYFIMVHRDDNAIKIYRSVNDVLSLKDTFNVTVDGQWNNYKVTYNPGSGKIMFWMNDAYIGTWTAGNPLASGNYISFRNGDSKTFFDNMRVFKKRGDTVTVTVGSGNNNDVRYENINPTHNACRIKSIVRDVANNWSAVKTDTVKIDWTPPTTITVEDGSSIDIDTTYTNNQLSANWNLSTDPNSDVVKYKYAIGAAPGDSDVVAWTNNGLNTSVTHTGLNLVYNQIYYFSVKAKNGAGLWSNHTSSDGIIVLSPPTAVSEEHHSPFNMEVFPNPFQDDFMVIYELQRSSSLEIKLMDVLGRNILILSEPRQNAGKHTLRVNTKLLGLNTGIYLLLFTSDGINRDIKIVYKR